MPNLEKLNLKNILLLCLLVSLLYFLPILIRPNLYLNRNNDLENFFWPNLYFAKDQILKTQTIPLWNSQILAGTPFIGDPQSPLYYPLNIIFLFLPIDLGLVVMFVLHGFLSAIFAYLLGRLGFGFSKIASLFLAFSYLFSPKLMGFGEAGHYGLIISFAYLPLAILSSIKITQKPTFTWAVIWAFSLSMIFFNHPLSFLIVGLASASLSIFLSLRKKTGFFIKSVSLMFFSFLIIVGLISFALLPQIQFSAKTNRFFLLSQPETYPIWNSKKEFLLSAINPLLLSDMNKLDTEKWIPIGIVIWTLSFLGFWRLKPIDKIALVFVGLLIVIISLNQNSGFFPLLIKFDWFKLLRVSTRPWIILVLILDLLASRFINQLIKKPANNILITLLISLTFIELISLSWAWILKPLPDSASQAPQELVEFIKQDHSLYRVFCLDRCISPKQAALAHLQTLDGYNTLIATNFYKEAWQLTQTYWGYYSLSVPPFGIIKYIKIKPDLNSLADYNVKYLISPYLLTDQNLLFINQYGHYYLYKNKIVLPRVYFRYQNYLSDNFPVITFNSPNYLRIDLSKKKDNSLVVANVYNPNWVAYLNGKKPVKVEEKPDALTSISLSVDTTFVDLKYQPTSFKVGLYILVITVSFIFLILVWEFSHYRFRIFR